MRTIATLLGVLLLAAIFSLCLTLRPPQIEADLLTKSQQLLASHQASWASIDIDGRDLTLSGIAPSEEARETTLQQLAEISGVRVVTYSETDEPDSKSDKATPNASQSASVSEAIQTIDEPGDTAELAAPPETLEVKPVTLPNIRAHYDGHNIEISGEVQGQASITKLTDYLNAIPGITQVNSDLSINPNITEDTSTEVLAAIDALTQLDAGDLEINHNQIALSGTSSHPETPNQNLETTLSNAIEKGYQVTANISAADHADTQEATCQQRFNQLLASSKILFKNGSSRILNASNPLLSKLTQAASDCPEVSITIAGYTDNTGSDRINRQLSMDRADAVKQYLIDHGIKPSRLSAQGRGSNNPIADNHTADGRAQNRRIEFIIGGN